MQTAAPKVLVRMAGARVLAQRLAPHGIGKQVGTTPGTGPGRPLPAGSGHAVGRQAAAGSGQAPVPQKQEAGGPPDQPAGERQVGVHGLKADPRLAAEQAFQAGKKYLHADDLQHAMVEFRRAADLMDASAEYRLYVQWLEWVGGNTAAEQSTALGATAREAAVQDPNLAFPRYVLGRLALAAGDVKHAKLLFKFAVKLDSTLLDAQRYLRLINLRKGSATPADAFQVFKPPPRPKEQDEAGEAQPPAAQPVGTVVATPPKPLEREEVAHAATESTTSEPVAAEAQQEAPVAAAPAPPGSPRRPWSRRLRSRRRTPSPPGTATPLMRLPPRCATPPRMRPLLRSLRKATTWLVHSRRRRRTGRRPPRRLPPRTSRSRPPHARRSRRRLGGLFLLACWSASSLAAAWCTWRSRRRRATSRPGWQQLLCRGPVSPPRPRKPERRELRRPQLPQSLRYPPCPRARWLPPARAPRRRPPLRRPEQLHRAVPSRQPRPQRRRPLPPRLARAASPGRRLPTARLASW